MHSFSSEWRANSRWSLGDPCSFPESRLRGAGAAASSAGNLSEDEESRGWVTSTGKVLEKHPKTINIFIMCGSQNEYYWPFHSTPCEHSCLGFSPWKERNCYSASKRHLKSRNFWVALQLHYFKLLNCQTNRNSCLHMSAWKLLPLVMEGVFFGIDLNYWLVEMQWMWNPT